MKRFLIVLFGVLVFQGSVWAESCLKAYPDDGSLVTAEILHPASSGLVLKKKAPFLLQWKVVEVSQTVNIRLYKKGAEGKDLFGKRLNNRPNTGTVLITKQDFIKAKVKAGEEYFFQVELNPTRSEQVISSECFTFNVKQKEDLQCNNATTVKDCLQALIEQNRQTAVEMRELTERLEALEGGGGTVGGGDGGDIDLSTAEGIKLACNGDNPGSFSIETCKGQPWVAANGVDVATNPVCWDSGVLWDTQVSPWVVGAAGMRTDRVEDYDCRTKCAQGEDFGWCAQKLWWDMPGARDVMCVWYDDDAEHQVTGRLTEWVGQYDGAVVVEGYSMCR